MLRGNTARIIKMRWGKELVSLLRGMRRELGMRRGSTRVH